MEDRPQVNLYIETSIKGPKIQDGEYIYVLEYIAAGVPVTRAGRGRQEATTENRLALEAVGRINRPACLRIYTRCGHVLHSLQNHWPRQWKTNGWKNAKGKPVSNVDLWEQLLEAMEPHVYTITEDDHWCLLKNAFGIRRGVTNAELMQMGFLNQKIL